MDFEALLQTIAAEVAGEVGLGKVADYIPALARVSPDRFGMAIAGVDGNVCGTGDWEEPFSIQSVSKVFTLALALGMPDGEGIWTRVGREPSGNPYNSLVQLEHENGVPRNPFINAGAMVVTDELMRQGDSVDLLRSFLTDQVGTGEILVDPEVASSELTHGDRNLALAHFMAAYGNLRHPAPEVVREYVRQCSIAMSCRQLAAAGLFLARQGLLRDDRRLLTRSQTKRINAVMLTCGTYDAAGEFAYRVGLPGKSGVGGGILAVVPGRCTIAVWSPGLDSRGNSIAGVAALDHFTTRTGWSVF